MHQFFWPDPLRSRHFDPAAASNTARNDAPVPLCISVLSRTHTHIHTHTHTETHGAPRGTRKRENSWDIYASHCLSPISFAAAAGRGLRRQLHSCGPLRVMNHQPRIVYTLGGSAPCRGGFVHECTRRCTRVSPCATHPPGCSRPARVLRAANSRKRAKKYLHGYPSELFPRALRSCEIAIGFDAVDAVACQSNSNICCNSYF